MAQPGSESGKQLLGKLKLHEGELKASLAKVDLGSLVEEGAAASVVSQEVKKCFESLAPSVSLPLKLRWLLLHTYQLLGRDPSLCDKWLQVLASHGVPEALIAKISSSVEPACEVREVSSDAQQPQSASKRLFREEHVAALTEILASCSGKWENLCIALNLPESVRRDIQARMHMHDNSVCLSEAFTAWIIRGHPHAKQPSVENLIKALRSQTVGLGKVANSLEENLNKHGLSFFKEEERINDHQSPSGRVIEGNSILLEVMAVAAGSNIFYQWIKDGSPLSDSVYCFGTKMPVLCLSDVTWATLGSYTCRIVARGCSSPVIVYSNPISITVDVNLETRVLVDKYLSLPELQQDTWPPLCSSKYIDLTLSKKLLDNIWFSDRSLEQETFKVFQRETLILVEGRPGSGKTTFTNKLSKRWAKGETLMGAKLVFLVALRVLPEGSCTLDDVLSLFYHDTEMVKKVHERISVTNGEGVCFILDGYDEYSSKDNRESFVVQLINKKYFQKSMVVLASRHVATAKIKRVAKFSIEVAGFSHDQLLQYIDCYQFTGANRTSEDLKAYLDQHPNIMKMCSVPVHASMVCFLHDKMETSLPDTESDIYKHFTLFTLLRKLRENDEYACLESMHDLTGEDRELFLALCKLAFDMTCSLKQVFSQKELPSHFFSTGIEKSYLGLVSVDCIAELYGMKNMYTFVHLTFQEYLAAFHLSLLADKEQSQVMSDYGNKNHMKVVWKFYCGMDSIKGHQSKLTRILSFHDDPLFRCWCSFESQDPTTCEIVAQHKSLKFNLDMIVVNPADLLSINYVLSNSGHYLEEFSFNLVQQFCKADEINKDYNSEVLVHLGTGLEKCINLKVLDLSYCNIGLNIAREYGTDLKLFCNLRVLKLCANNIGNEGAVALASGLTFCSNLESLYLGLNKIGEDGIKALCNTLANNQILKLLHFSDVLVCPLSRNLINDNAALALSNLFKKCKQLQSLAFGDCNLTDTGLTSLAKGLECCSNLLMLDFSDNRVSMNTSVAACLRHCCTLQTLMLGGMLMKNEAALAISKCLKTLGDVQVLDFSRNCMYDYKVVSPSEGQNFHISIGPLRLSLIHSSSLLRPRFKFNSDEYYHNFHTNGDAFHIICQSLIHCSSLLELYFNCCSIGDSGICSFARSLVHCKILSTLELQGNLISYIGIKALAENMKHWAFNLKVLSLRDNAELSDSGVKVLGEGLKNCKNLELLDLMNCGLENEGASSISESIKHCEKLEELYVDFNQIGDEGAMSFLCQLEHNKLQRLGLYSNPITNACAENLKNYSIFVFHSSVRYFFTFHY